MKHARRPCDHGAASVRPDHAPLSPPRAAPPRAHGRRRAARGRARRRSRRRRRHRRRTRSGRPRPGVYVVTLAAPPAAVHAGDPARAAVRASTGPGPRSPRTPTGCAAEQDRVLHAVGDPAVLYRYTTALNGFAATLDQRPGPAGCAATAGVALRRAQHQAARRPGTRAVGRAGRRQQLARPARPRRPGRRLGAARRPGSAPGTASWSASSTPASGRTTRASAGCRSARPAPRRAPARLPRRLRRRPRSGRPRTATDKVVSARWFVNGLRRGERRRRGVPLPPRRHRPRLARRVDRRRRPRRPRRGRRPALRHHLRDGAGGPARGLQGVLDRARPGAGRLHHRRHRRRGRPGGGRRRRRPELLGVRQPTGVDDAVERAFLGAATAGVFVATSAGNDGRARRDRRRTSRPGSPPSAASTHHAFQGAVRLGDGRSLVGRDGLRPAGAVHPSRARRATSRPPAPTPTRPGCARPAASTPPRPQGTIVVCDRGDGARVDKSATVASAGGAGMVLANTRPQSTDADVHAVPTVHLDADRGARAVEAYVRRAGAGATAALDPRGRTDVPGARRSPASPGAARRSSAGGDVLKPDLTAPGRERARRGRPAVGLRPVLGPGLRYVDQRAARRRAGGVHRRRAPGLVAGPDQVRDDDHRLRPAGAARPARRGRRPRRPAARSSTRAWSSTPRPRAVAAVRRRASRRQRRQRPVARGRRPGRPDHRHPPDHQRQRPARVLLRPQARPRRRRRAGLPGDRAAARPGRAAPSGCGSPPGRPRPSTATSPAGWCGAATGTACGSRSSVRPTVVAAPRQVAGSGDSGTVVGARAAPATAAPSSCTAPAWCPRPTDAGRADPGTVRRDRARRATRTRAAAAGAACPAGTDVARFAATSGAAGDDVDLYVYRDGTLRGLLDRLLPRAPR